MAAIVNNYNKGQIVLLDPIPTPIVPIPVAPLPVQVSHNPLRAREREGPLVLNASGQLMQSDGSNRSVISVAASQNRPTPLRSPRTIRRAGENNNNRQQDPMLLDLGRRSSEVDLDLNRRSGTVEIEIPPDPPGYWNISEDLFGSR
jgi:hypothetical protein